MMHKKIITTVNRNWSSCAVSFRAVTCRVWMKGTFSTQSFSSVWRMLVLCSGRRFSGSWRSRRQPRECGGPSQIVRAQPRWMANSRPQAASWRSCTGSCRSSMPGPWPQRRTPQVPKTDRLLECILIKWQHLNLSSHHGKTEGCILKEIPWKEVISLSCPKNVVQSGAWYRDNYCRQIGIEFCTYSAYGKFSDPFNFPCFLFRTHLKMDSIKFFLINLQTILHSDKAETAFTLSLHWVPSISTWLKYHWLQCKAWHTDTIDCLFLTQVKQNL